MVKFRAFFFSPPPLINIVQVNLYGKIMASYFQNGVTLHNWLSSLVVRGL